MPRPVRDPLTRVVGVALVVGLLAAAVGIDRRSDGDRLGRADSLGELISAEREATEALRRDLDELRTRRDRLVTSATPVGDPGLDSARRLAGVDPRRGAGLRVVLDDSDLEESPTGNVNDLVIHSADVQGVVNALWRAGASAVAINDERVVVTSAVLCVGNTLLLNGTVHAPPYVIEAIGAAREPFVANPSVSQFRAAATLLGLGLDVDEVDDLEIDAYTGRVQPRHAVVSVEVDAETV